jgi:hypothetical protein
MKKTITIRKIVTEEKEITFPFVTLDREMDRIYFNYAPDKCVYLSTATKSIIHSSLSNEGLEFEEIRPEYFYQELDKNIAFILDKLQK